MTFALKPLPYQPDALEPVMSSRTVSIHHGRHQAGYVAKLNDLVADGPLARAELTSIVRASSTKPRQSAIFNSAAQVFNHEFFWDGLSPEPVAPPDSILQAINASFQSLDTFRRRFCEVATAHFGSGWIWLVADGQRLDVIATHDAETPINGSTFPLFACDVWEHAYYLDYENMRGDYVGAVVDRLINWQQIARRLDQARTVARELQQARRRQA